MAGPEECKGECNIGCRPEKISQDMLGGGEMVGGGPLITSMREHNIGVANMGMNDSKTNTRLLEKNYSPLIVRKYQTFGWPMFVSLICDLSLSDLDMVVNKAVDTAEEMGMKKNDIQAQRNFCGYLSDYLVAHYNSVKANSVEGVAILAYWDKCFCSSLYGDFMTHGNCKQELFLIVNLLAHI